MGEVDDGVDEDVDEDVDPPVVVVPAPLEAVVAVAWAERCALEPLHDTTVEAAIAATPSLQNLGTELDRISECPLSLGVPNHYSIYPCSDLTSVFLAVLAACCF